MSAMAVAEQQGLKKLTFLTRDVANMGDIVIRAHNLL